MISDLGAYLQKRLEETDPWKLDSSPYEQQRYEAMKSLLLERAPFPQALEVGCAAGVFTSHLANYVEELDVLDVAPAAVSRTAQRTEKLRNINLYLGDISGWQGSGHQYDLIVACEILYYLGDWAAVKSVVDKLVLWLRPNGVLLFGSMLDELLRDRFAPGAETVISYLQTILVPLQELACVGVGSHEKARLALFQRADYKTQLY